VKIKHFVGLLEGLMTAIPGGIGSSFLGFEKAKTPFCSFVA
jgi:hypothetical protein